MDNVVDLTAVSPAHRLSVMLQARIKREGITTQNIGELDSMFRRMMDSAKASNPELRSR